MSLQIDTSRPEQIKVRFLWPSAEPDGTISVVGSFNNWTPGLDELLDGPDGIRAVTIGLPYGVGILFRYLGPDGQWFDDPDADEITARGSIVRPISHVAAPDDDVAGASPQGLNGAPEAAADPL